MAFRVPLAEHPDHHFVYETDLTQYTRREAVKIVGGSLVMFLVVFAFLFALGLAQ